MPDTTTQAWFCPQVDETTGWRCPAGSHDTYSARRHGCESPAAKEDRRLYMKRRTEGRAPQRREFNYVGVTRRAQAAALMGWDRRATAAELGISSSTLWNILEGRLAFLLSSSVPDLIAKLERLAMTPGPSRRAKHAAQRRGWCSLLAWDDVDDPSEVPPPPVSDAEQVAELAAQGRSTAYIARKLDLSPRRVAYLRDRRKNVVLPPVEIDEHLFDAVLDGRTPFADCTVAEQDHVLGRLWRDAVAQGYEHPGPQVADRLGVDVVVIDRFRSREHSRRIRTREESP